MNNKYQSIPFEKEYAFFKYDDDYAEHYKLLSDKKSDLDAAYKNDSDPKNLAKYLGIHSEYDQQSTKESFKSHWFVGERWLTENVYLKVNQPKIDGLDCLRMYLCCLEDDETARHLDDCFGLEVEEKFIPDSQQFDIITPMLIASFLRKTYKIVRHSIKYNYIQIEHNLTGKVKGKISVNENIKRNLSRLQPHRLFCKFQVFAANCLENRILKAALEKSSRYLNCHSSIHNNTLSEWLTYSKAALENVSLVEVSNTDFNKIHYGSFFKDYKHAHELARLIFKRLGFSLEQNTDNYLNTTPPFWINMNELFERYCENWLRKHLGIKNLWVGYNNKNLGAESGIRFRPDFLINIRGEKIIADAKYKEYYKTQQSKV